MFLSLNVFLLDFYAILVTSRYEVNIDVLHLQTIAYNSSSNLSNLVMEDLHLICMLLMSCQEQIVAIHRLFVFYIP